MKTYLKLLILWLFVVPLVTTFELVCEIIALPFSMAQPLWDFFPEVWRTLKDNWKAGTAVHRETLNPGCLREERIREFLGR